jgi:hypothetical protein
MKDQNFLDLREGDKSIEVTILNNYLKYFRYYPGYEFDALNLEGWQKIGEDFGKSADDLEPELFDDKTSVAIKRFQSECGFPLSGIVDEQTLKTIMNPRCSIPYFGQPAAAADADAFVTVPEPWGRFKQVDLSYKFIPSQHDPPTLTTARIRQIINGAFAKWGAVTFSRNNSITHFDFREVTDQSTMADIELSFSQGIHGPWADGPFDPYPFNGYNIFAIDPNLRTVAHAFPTVAKRDPAIAYVHFNKYCPWSDNIQTGINLAATALHEIGHTLGLDHTNRHQPGIHQEAIMFSEHSNMKIQLTEDDINGLRYIYSL